MDRQPRLPAEVHHGDRTFARAELDALATPHHVRAAITSGELTAVLPGHYASTPHHASFRVRAHAGVAATSGVVTGAAALFIWGGAARAPEQVMVAHRGGRRAHGARWIRLVQVRALPRLAWWSGVPVATPATAVLHEWNHGDPAEGTGRVLNALRRRATTAIDVRLALGEVSRIRDRAGLLETLDAFDAGAHSFLEFEGLSRTFAHRDFARFVRQHRVDTRGRRYFLDMYDPATRTDVELDGAEFHSLAHDRERDLQRDADLAALGIQTVRLSYRKVMDDPEWCRRTVRTVLAIREKAE